MTMNVVRCTLWIWAINFVNTKQTFETLSMFCALFMALILLYNFHCAAETCFWRHWLQFYCCISRFNRSNHLCWLLYVFDARWILYKDSSTIYCDSKWNICNELLYGGAFLASLIPKRSHCINFVVILISDTMNLTKSFKEQLLLCIEKHNWIMYISPDLTMYF